MDKKIIDLLNRDIDGVTSPEEHARLQRLMEVDGEVRRLHSDMLHLTASLGNTAKVDPPPSLKPAVMRSVLAPPRVPARWPFPERMKILFRPLANARIGLVFAAGVIAGILLYVAAGPVLPSSVKEIDLTGAFLPHRTPGHVNTDIAEAGTHFTLATSYAHDLCLLRLSVRTQGEVRTQLLFDDGVVQVGSISFPAETPRNMQIAAGKIEIFGGPVDDLIVTFSPRSRGSVQPVVRVRVTGPQGDRVERSIPVISPAGE